MGGRSTSSFQTDPFAADMTLESLWVAWMAMPGHGKPPVQDGMGWRPRGVWHGARSPLHRSGRITSYAGRSRKLVGLVFSGDLVGIWRKFLVNILISFRQGYGRAQRARAVAPHGSIAWSAHEMLRFSQMGHI